METNIPPALDVNSDKCPVCLNDKYLNQNMKLLVSPCYHKMCESCVARIFNAGPAPCPICQTTLRKMNFIQQTFDDLYVEREIQIRRKVGKYFIKRREDFGSLREFNDYLEEAEDLIFNLISNVNIQETEEKIEQFRLQNKDIIKKNMQKQLLEEKALMRDLSREKREKQLRKEAYEKQASEEARLKQLQHEDVINRLATDEGNASEIILDSKSKAKKGSKKTGFQKINLIHVEVENDDQLQEEPIDLAFDPLGAADMTTDYRLQLEPNFVYSCGWTSLLLKDNSEALLQAEGYSSTIHWRKALDMATLDLFSGL